MAKAGNFAAYQQLRPLEGDISADIKYWNEDRDHKRQQKTYEDELAYQKEKDAKAEKQARYDKYIKPINNYDTGSQSLNEFNGRMIMQAKEKYLPLMQVLENPNSSEEQKIKAQINLQELASFPEKLKLATDTYTQQWQAYQEAKESGVAWAKPEMEKAFQNGFKNFQGGIDDNMNPIISFIDKDGDGENDILAAQSYEEISQGMPLFDFQKKHNIEAIATDLSANLTKGIKDITTRDGYSSERVKAVTAQDREALIQNTLFTPEGKMSSITKSALIEAGVNPSQATQKDIDGVKSRVTDLVNSQLPEIREEDYDFTAQNNARKESRIQRESDGSQSFTDIEVVEPSKTVYDDKLSLIPEGVKSSGLPNVNVGAIKGEEGSVSDANLKNYTFIEGGKMLLEVETVKTKSISETEYKKMELEFKEGTLATEQLDNFLAMRDQKPGSRRITYPSQSERTVLTIPKEDQALVARKAKTTIKGLQEKVGYDPNSKSKSSGSSSAQVSEKSKVL